MFKKLLLLSFTAMLLTSATSCGSSEEESNGSSQGSSSQAEQSDSAIADSSSSEPETEQSVTDESSQTSGETLGQTILQEFKDIANNDKDASLQTIADKLLSNPAIKFMGSTVPVEQGLLTGFGNTEIKGFSDGIMFAPNISTIAFVGYIFELDRKTNAEEFKTLLKDNANPAWNVCTEADETIISQVDNRVFFLMSPRSIED